ncbi:MAG: DegT/DnrJ/EryC1/StrS aminotransferase family protein [Planctomycetota bacterium]|jgi:L-glutamine:2-deoxy-scyllo-inosose/3-amino-2,3-dideoxy-scyllo-inosose aminotransferase
MAATTEEVLAVQGGQKAVTAPAPQWPVHDEVEEGYLLEALRSGVWSWVGPQEQAFCEAYRELIGTRFCAALSNGTVTLQCALQAVGVEPGDEVIVPGLTWVATAQAAMDIGANVVLVDVDPVTQCLDPDAFAAAITPKTKAVIPVHLYGCMCDMDRIMEIARENGIKVVEDVAHQHGGQWRGVSAGAIGDVGSFSFQQSKVLSCGEGGAITTNDPDTYQTIFALKQVGWTPGDPEADAYGGLIEGDRYGHNYRITEMQAAILRGGVSRLLEQTAVRERNAARIGEHLESLGGPLRAAPRDPRVTRQAYYALTLCFDPDAVSGLTRKMVTKALGAEGCLLNAVYPPVYRSHLLNLYDTTSPIPYRDPAAIQDYKSLRLPNVERIVEETGLVIPHQVLLGDDQYIDQWLKAFTKVMERAGSLV